MVTSVSWNVYIGQSIWLPQSTGMFTLDSQYGYLSQLECLHRTVDMVTSISLNVHIGWSTWLPQSACIVTSVSQYLYISQSIWLPQSAGMFPSVSQSRYLSQLECLHRSVSMLTSLNRYFTLVSQYSYILRSTWLPHSASILHWSVSIVTS